MKILRSMSVAVFSAGLGILSAHQSVAYVVNIPAGVSLDGAHMNVVWNQIVSPLNDNGFTPPNTLNAFYFIPFNNSTTTLGPSVYYENDFTPNNMGPGWAGWATDASGTAPAPAPTWNAGDGGFILNQLGAVAVNFAGAAAGFLPLPPVKTWYLVASKAPVAAQFQNIFGVAPPDKTVVARWNGASFFFTTYHASTATWDNGVPTLRVGESAFVQLDPDPPLTPVAAAAGPDCAVGNTILLTFNRDLGPASATVAGNYTVTKQGGINVAVQSAVVYGATAPFLVVPSTRCVLLTLAAPLVPAANYTVGVHGVQDLIGETTANSTVSFLAGTTPRVIGAECNGDNTHVVVTFDRPMDRTSVANAANYSVVSICGDGVLVSGATALGPASLPVYPGARARLTVSGLASNTTYVVTVNNITSACGVPVTGGTSVSFLGPVASPTLHMQPAGPNLLLSWQGTNFGLQQSANWSIPNSWQNSSATESIFCDNVTTQVPSSVGTMFFRLSLKH